MTRILHITYEAPSRQSGGGLGILQSLISTSDSGIVDYVGPEFDTLEFPEISINKYIFLEKEKSLTKKIKSLLLGVSMGSYYPWINVCKSIDLSLYDVVYIDFSRHDYIVKWAKNHQKPVIVRVHNIEQDYFKRVVCSNVEIKLRIASFIKYLSMKKRESYCMKHADKLLFLTQTDLDRANNIYKMMSFDSRTQIMPVCISKKQRSDIHTDIMEKYFLITGSLWYGANADGVMWFLEKVWKQTSEILQEYSLVIAGARPNAEIKKACTDSARCILVDTPDDMTPHFNDASIYIAPVFDGAGMKVKVAEAMSYGLPVIGTKHAMIGYEKSFGVNKIISSAEECSVAMVEICKNLKSFDREHIMTVFDQNYDIGVSKKIVKNTIERVRG